jgi:hypothetical protein
VAVGAGGLRIAAAIWRWPSNRNADDFRFLDRPASGRIWANPTEETFSNLTD